MSSIAGRCNQSSRFFSSQGDVPLTSPQRKWIVSQKLPEFGKAIHHRLDNKDIRWAFSKNCCSKKRSKQFAFASSGKILVSLTNNRGVELAFSSQIIQSLISIHSPKHVLDLEPSIDHYDSRIIMVKVLLPYFLSFLSYPNLLQFINILALDTLSEISARKGSADKGDDF